MLMAIFTNQATLSYNDNVVNSNIVTGEILEVLSATKTAVSASYEAGDTVTYAVSIINAGTAGYTDLTLTDDLGSYSFGGTEVTPLSYIPDSVKYYVNGVLQAAPAVTAGPPLVIGGINVPADGNAMLIYSAAVNGFAPLAENSTIENTVTVTGEALTTPITASETITVNDAVNLTITKDISPTSIVTGGPITYTFTIRNYGNIAAIATDNASISDSFDPIINIQNVTFNGTAWSEPENYTYNETTGLFTTVPGQITVPAASYTQDPATGVWSVTPGTAVLVVSGTI